MSKKEPHSQLELFSAPENSAGVKATVHGQLWGYVQNYEKAIIVSICFLLSSVISFTLGIEKGKRLSFIKENPKFDLATPKQATEPMVSPSTPYTRSELSRAESRDAVEPPALRLRSVQAQKNFKNFTIQLASYQKKAYAQKEADTLKKKGLTPLVISKGAYIIVCVGNFSDKERAKYLLSELKKKYRDGFIRRL